MNLLARMAVFELAYLKIMDWMKHLKRTKEWSPILWLLLALTLAGCTANGRNEAAVAAAQQLESTAAVALQESSDSLQPSQSPNVTATATTRSTQTAVASDTPVPTVPPTATATATPEHPLMIEVLRQGEYPGSDIVFERTLDPGDNFGRFVVSYLSEGNKIFALMTVPWGLKPDSGWPVIIFNHGYVRPDLYRTTERYIDYVDYFARNGYIVFRSDYRGHGSSEGVANGPYSSPDYTIDVLNGMASVKMYPEADPARIGMWGHSMGGHLTLRSMVVSDEIKAGVIWAGVVGAHPDLFARALTPEDPSHTPTPSSTRWPTRWRTRLLDSFGTRDENPAFWDSISANAYLDQISGPLQLHHATTDSTVPVAVSELLQKQMEEAGEASELFLYEGDNHNIAVNFYTAMGSSLDFFDKHVKGVVREE